MKNVCLRTLHKSKTWNNKQNLRRLVFGTRLWSWFPSHRIKQKIHSHTWKEWPLKWLMSKMEGTSTSGFWIRIHSTLRLRPKWLHLINQRLKTFRSQFWRELYVLLWAPKTVNGTVPKFWPLWVKDNFRLHSLTTVSLILSIKKTWENCMHPYSSTSLVPRDAP